MPTGMRAAPTRPVGQPDVLWGLPGQGGLLTEWAETVPDLTWPESVRTYGRMRRDARLSAVLKAFFLPIIRSTWTVDPSGARDEAAALVAGDLGLPILGQPRSKDAPASPVKGFAWGDHVRLALLHLVFGHMPFEQWYQVAKGRTHLAGLSERMPHTISMIDVDDGGQIRQVWQNTQNDPLAANRLLWYANEREGANWAGVSMLRSCYTSWVLKHETMRVHATSLRRFGMGIPVVTAPANATPGQVAEAQKLAAGMRAGDQSGAGLPQGFTFELVGIRGASPDAVAFLNYCDQQMTGSALAQIVELASSTYGSRAVGDSFVDLFLLALQAVADYIAETVTYGYPAMPGIARALTEYNWGPDEAVPRIVCGDVGDRHEVTAASISSLVTAGALSYDPALETYLREAYGLPARDKNFPPPGAPAQAPPPPGQAPGGTGGGEAAPGPGGTGAGGGASTGDAGDGTAPDPFAPAASARVHAAAGPGSGLRRQLTETEIAAAFEPELVRAQADGAVTALRTVWEPVQRAMTQDIAEQVAAAVDDGHLDHIARAVPSTADAAGIITAAMQDQAWRGAMQVVREAAAQGVLIDPAAISLDDAQLGSVAKARAGMIGGRLANEAASKTLTIVKPTGQVAAASTSGASAASQVTVHLAGLSESPLEAQLLAAMTAATNMGRIAAAHAGMDTTGGTPYATEILDSNTCQPCLRVDGQPFASVAEAEAAYPAGGYRDCDGGLRCRGTVIFRWDGEDNGQGGLDAGPAGPVEPPPGAVATSNLLTYPAPHVADRLAARAAPHGGITALQAAPAPAGKPVIVHRSKIRTLAPQPGQDSVDAYRTRLASGAPMPKGAALARAIYDAGMYYLVSRNHLVAAQVLAGVADIAVWALDLGAEGGTAGTGTAAGEVTAGYSPGERRDREGKWDGGGPHPQGADTPIPAGHPAHRILDKWVQQGGSGTLTKPEQESLTAAVNYYGQQVPAGLVRGEHDKPASRYAAGKVIKLAPGSFTTEEESALPYAESGGKNPVVLHLDQHHGVKGLNVGERAARQAGFNEQEWVLAHKVKVTGSRVDAEGIRHVTVVPAGAVEASAAVQAGGGFSPGEARDGHGRWSGHEGAGLIRRTAKGRLAAQTPSRFTHPGTGHAMGKTEIGDTYEALFQAKGAHLLTARFGGPYRAISGQVKQDGGRGARNTPLDFALDHSHAGELKTLNVKAKSQKTAIKAGEVARKEGAARSQGMAPLLVVQVVDPDAGQVKVYAYPAFASKTTTAMESLGSYSYTPGDFQNAQEATGHWDQRDTRAAKQAAQGTVSAAGAPADPDALPDDPPPAPGDTVIELRDGVPYIGTHPGGGGGLGKAASGDDGDGDGPFLNVTARFDPGEKRDPDGKWVAGAVKALDVRQRVGFKGHDIDRTASKGYRVRLKSGDVRHYERPEHAAQAALLGAHFTPQAAKAEAPAAPVPLKFRRDSDGYHRAMDGEHAYDIHQDKSSPAAPWQLKIRQAAETAGVRHAVGQPPVAEDQFRTLTEAKAVAHAHSQLGPGYQQSAHGGKSRLTTAIGNAYDKMRAEDLKDTPKAPPADPPHGDGFDKGDHVEISLSDAGWVKGQVVRRTGKEVAVKTRNGSTNTARLDGGRLRKPGTPGKPAGPPPDPDDVAIADHLVKNPADTAHFTDHELRKADAEFKRRAPGQPPTAPHQAVRDELARRTAKPEPAPDPQPAGPLSHDDAMAAVARRASYRTADGTPVPGPVTPRHLGALNKLTAGEAATLARHVSGISIIDGKRVTPEAARAAVGAPAKAALGVYWRKTRALAFPSQQGSGLVALHETGHALDHAYGSASASPEWQRLDGQVLAHVPHPEPHFHPAGTAGPDISRKERFAELFAQHKLGRQYYIGGGIAGHLPAALTASLNAYFESLHDSRAGHVTAAADDDDGHLCAALPGRGAAVTYQARHQPGPPHAAWQAHAAGPAASGPRDGHPDVTGTTAAQAASAIACAGPGTIAEVNERLRSAWPGGYRQALNDGPPAPATVLPAAGLRTVMPQPYPERVDGYRAQIRNGHDPGPSLALPHGGHHVLVDGTHRAVARVLEGQAAAVPVIVLDPAAHAASWDQDGDDYLDVTAAYSPAEKRDAHGRWLNGAVSSLAVRQRVGYQGHDIDRTASKGYRVRLKTGEVRHYEKPEHAAQAALLGEHFTPQQAKPEPAATRNRVTTKTGKLQPSISEPAAEPKVVRDYLRLHQLSGRTGVTARPAGKPGTWTITGLGQPRAVNEQQMAGKIAELTGTSRVPDLPGSAPPPAPSPRPAGVKLTAKALLGSRTTYETQDGQPARTGRPVGALQRLTAPEARLFAERQQHIVVVQGESIDQALAAHGHHGNDSGEKGHGVGAYSPELGMLYLASHHLNDEVPLHEMGHFLDHAAAAATDQPQTPLSGQDAFRQLDAKVLAASPALFSHFDPRFRGENGSRRERFAELFGQFKRGKPYDLHRRGNRLPPALTAQLDRYFTQVEQNLAGYYAAADRGTAAAAAGGDGPFTGCVALSDGSYVPLAATGPAAAWDQDGDDYLDVTAAYDPKEKRDAHGRWLNGAVSSLAVRTRIGFKGHDIDRTASKGYRVRLKSGEVQHYEHPHDAAEAARRGQHFNPKAEDAGALKELEGVKLPGRPPAREPARPVITFGPGPHARPAGPELPPAVRAFVDMHAERGNHVTAEPVKVFPGQWSVRGLPGHAGQAKVMHQDDMAAAVRRRTDEKIANQARLKPPPAPRVKPARPPAPGSTDDAVNTLVRKTTWHGPLGGELPGRGRTTAAHIGGLSRLTPAEAGTLARHLTGLHIVTGNKITHGTARKLTGSGYRSEKGSHTIGLYNPQSRTLVLTESHLNKAANRHAGDVDLHEAAHALDHAYGYPSSSAEFRALDKRALAEAPNPGVHYDPAKAVGGADGSRRERFAELFAQYKARKAYNLGGWDKQHLDQPPFPMQLDADLDAYFASLHTARGHLVRAAAAREDHMCVAVLHQGHVEYRHVPISATQEG